MDSSGFIKHDEDNGKDYTAQTFDKNTSTCFKRSKEIKKKTK